MNLLKMVKPDKISILLIVLIIIIGFTNCTTAKKATNFMLTHPEVNAPLCSIQFPVKDSLIKGDSVIVTDTVTTEGKTDTLVTKDTVRITTTLPAKVITKTVHIKDTIIRENFARVTQLLNQVAECNNAGLVLSRKNDDLKESLAAMKKLRNKWRLWLFVALGAAGMFTFLKIKKIF